ncbi:uncharacterized protein LOC130737629 [Lotus japonicus]|uniref:uncharacterized protein LOC130737629 n=1 Tax=Lotus japonicus TaxID=34305 RepID=UPI0025904233|nr:uncharacterized protein LOC130737629 [Lotus japonicus]
MVMTRASAMGDGEGNSESEELRVRVEVNEARTKQVEDAIAETAVRARRIEDTLHAVLTRLGIATLDEVGTCDVRSETVLESNLDRDRTGSKWRKLEIPVFGGDDAFGWVQKLERYFQLREVTEEEKMQATLLALEGKALSWFQWWERCNPRPSWEAFKVAVVRRFQPAMMQNPFELLLSLKQTDTVEVFVEEFEKYVGALRDRSRFCQGNLLEWLEGGDSCRGKTL